MDALQVQRQLVEGLLQHTYRFVELADAALLQRDHQLLHLFCQQGCAVKLDHQQAAMHLMHARQTLRQRFGRRLPAVAVQCHAGLLQGFGNFAFDPLKGHIVVPVNHNDSPQTYAALVRPWCFLRVRQGKTGHRAPQLAGHFGQVANAVGGSG